MATTPSLRKILEQYEFDSLYFSNDANASDERHLVFDNVMDPKEAFPRCDRGETEAKII